MKTKERLINLCESAIRTNGFGGFSYADLARQAGIRKASIHHHFPTKAEMGLTVLNNYAGQLEQTLARIANDHSSSQSALKAAVNIYRSALGDGNQMCLCSALAGDGAKLDKAIQTRLAQTNAMVAQWFEKECNMEKSAAIALLAQLQGAQLVARAAGDVTLFDAAVSTIITPAS